MVLGILQINLEHIDVPPRFGKNPFEYQVIQYFKKKGYEVVDLASQRSMYVEVNGKNIKPEEGRPDFYVYNGKEGFFIEVKSSKDSLRINQLKWLLKHSKEKYVLVLEK